MIIGKREEAKERRLVPEVIEDFFIKASPLTGLDLKAGKQRQRIYRLDKVPKLLWPIGEELEPRFGKLGKEYRLIVFDKDLLSENPTAEWVTPGHPLFEAVRLYTCRQVEDDLRRGAIFFDLYSPDPYRLDVYTATVNDGLGNDIHKRIFVVQTAMDGTVTIRQPTIFLDLIPSTTSVSIPDGKDLPGRDQPRANPIQSSFAAIPGGGRRTAGKGDQNNRGSYGDQPKRADGQAKPDPLRTGGEAASRGYFSTYCCQCKDGRG